MAETKYGFTKMTIDEFEAWIAGLSIGRTILRIQQHHTWSPRYMHFNGSNHFDLQKGMKAFHVGKGWNDIGQHFTTFPDGTIVTGRSMEQHPACIENANAGGICIENLGDFDTNKDVMTQAQADTIVRMTAAMLKRFNLGNPDINNVVYHHWYELGTGIKKMGGGSTKSCPGTNFFGGNKRQHFEANFAPKVLAAMGGVPAPVPIVVDGWVCVNADSLNVRTGPGTTNPKAPDKEPQLLGAILRVYARQDGWLKISNSKEHWVSGSRTYAVTRGTINTEDSNVRSGAAATFPVIDVRQPGEIVFVHETKGAWSRIAMDSQWVGSSLVTPG